jgi:hypothetical protein
MGILIAGYLGAMYNKLGNAVGSNWKGINTIRTYAIPANPQSVLQTAQRTKFKTVSLFAKSVLSTLVTTFWNPFAVQMSGYNFLVKTIFPDSSATGILTASCKVAKGSLETVPILSALYNNLSGELTLFWNATILGNGLDTDTINVLVVNNVNNSVNYYATNIDARSAGETLLTIPTGLVVANMLVYIWASRGTGSDFMVSDSFGVIASVS